MNPPPEQKIVRITFAIRLISILAATLLAAVLGLMIHLILDNRSLQEAIRVQAEQNGVTSTNVEKIVKRIDSCTRSKGSCYKKYNTGSAKILRDEAIAGIICESRGITKEPQLRRCILEEISEGRD